MNTWVTLSTIQLLWIWNADIHMVRQNALWHVSKAKKLLKTVLLCAPVKILIRTAPSTYLEKQAEQLSFLFLHELPLHIIFQHLSYQDSKQKNLNKQCICLVKMYIHICSYRIAYNRNSSCLLAGFCLSMSQWVSQQNTRKNQTLLKIRHSRINH